MSTKHFKLRRPGIKPSLPGCLLVTFAILLAALSIQAGTTVTTLAGGKPSKYYGYVDTTTLQSLFHTPCGLAIDNTGKSLYVADRDNNVIRWIDFQGGLTWTLDLEPTNMISKPVGIALDNVTESFVVLNFGNGKNGSVVSFDAFGDIEATNASNITNAGAITIDYLGNLYITTSNSIIKILPNGVKTTLVTIAVAGTDLQGITALNSGQLAVCDAGRNGIYNVDPISGAFTTNAGFNGTGDFKTNSTDLDPVYKAKFNHPVGITEAGDGSLIVSDYNNNRLKVISAGIVTNLAGVTQKYWHGNFPGWMDGPVSVPDSNPTNAESRQPFGVVFSPDGTVYMSEDFYHTIRKVTGAGFGLPPPPPPQVTAPQIGYVTFPANSPNVAYTSVFVPVPNSFIFNNDAPIVIVGEPGSATYYTFSNTPTIGLVPNPTSASAQANSGYQNGLDPGQVQNFAVAGVAPNVAIKAISEKNDGSPNSPIAEALFQYIVGNPLVLGGNSAQFTISEITSNALLYYTIDGSDPTTNPAALTMPFSFSTNSGTYIANLNFGIDNFIFKAFARRANYQDSQVVSNLFSAANFSPNVISFGVTNGQPSSAFLARPGQFYYAPVTLQLQPGGETMYSLQFNVTVTNGLATTNKIVGGNGFNFFSMLMSQVSPTEGDHFPPNNLNWFLEIPSIIGDQYSSTIFINTNENLLGVGWLFRLGVKYKSIGVPFQPNIDFDTGSQDLITYSIAHDTLFNKGGGVVIVGAYAFQVPTNANLGDTYFIQIGSPSGTRDGAGAPGEDVYIQAPANSTKVTIGNPSYLVGDVAPFRWLDAGDFGNSNLDSADVQQVFQSAIELLDVPPTNSDLFAAMDSSGTFGSFDSVHGYYTNTPSFANLAALFDGSDQTINTNCFGDGILDVSDVYVTFRRSLDPSLNWFIRFWTNGQFVAESTPNLAFNINNSSVQVSQSQALTKSRSSKSNVQPNPLNSSVVFNAGDAITSAGQTVQIPITANVLGDYPLRLLGLNVTAEPLDGSPPITQTVQFSPSAGLGAATMLAQMYPGNYCGAWLSNSIAGLTGSNALLGTLYVPIPTNATTSSAYSIHFNHASGSPNGLASFPNQKFTGLITLSSRNSSFYNDGIPDSWRLRWFGTIYNALSQSNADACGDGISNWQKYIAGVDPTIPHAFPQLKPVSPVPAGYKSIHWPTVYGKKYVVLRSPNLFTPTWSILSTNAGTGGDMEFDDNSTGQVQFYRVLIQP
jgi:hypothetical protein